MYKISTVIAFSIGLLLTGCAGSSGVVPLDKGTYYVSETDGWHYGPPSAETINKVYTQARNTCLKKAKIVKSINKQSQVGAYGVYPSYSLEFRCVEE